MEIITKENQPVQWEKSDAISTLEATVMGAKGEKDEGIGKIVVMLSEALLVYSSLRHCIDVPRDGKFLFYNVQRHIYVLEEYNMMKHYTRVLLNTLLVRCRLQPSVADKVGKMVLSNAPRQTFDSFSQELRVLPFSDGNLLLDTNDFKPIPDFDSCVTYRLPYPFDADDQCPIFDKYIFDLAEGHEDRVELLKSFMYAVIFSMADLHRWMHVYGEGGGGKSIYGHLCMLMVGEEASIGSRIDLINNDTFEAQHLADKKLVICPETQDWNKNMENLKSLVGGDTMPVRQKHQNTQDHLNFRGMLLLIGNHPLQTRDTGGSIRRRHNFVYVSVGNKGNVPLIEQDTHTRVWKGPMVKELGAINRKIRSMDRARVTEVLLNFPTLCPSQLDIWENLMETFDPLEAFVIECLVDGGMAYIGARAKDTASARIEVKARKTIYPAYHEWAVRRGEKPLGVRNFGTYLISSMKTQGKDAYVKRGNHGLELHGAQLIPEFWDIDMEHASPLSASSKVLAPPVIPDVLEDAERVGDTVKYIDHKGDPFVPIQSLNASDLQMLRTWSAKRHLCVPEFMYEEYISQYRSSEFKTCINKVGKILVKDPLFSDQSLAPYMNVSPISSDAFKADVMNVIESAVKKLKSFGFCPFTYKVMGTSPRIQPQTGDFSPNSVKRHVRTTFLTWLGDVLARETGYTIVDYDLVSCYTSILRGLYGDYLVSVNEALNGIGLWKSIENQFKDANMGESFHKDSVKICVYSSFFQGGSGTMAKGIQDKFREIAGLKQREFDKSTYFQLVHSFSQLIAQFMKNNVYINEFRQVSEIVKEKHMGQELKGPTGITSVITKDNFRFAYSDMLQSYEITLVASTMNVVKAKYPQVELLTHMHDGVTLAIPNDLVGEVTDCVNRETDAMRLALGLSHSQKMEIKDSFGILPNKEHKDNPEVLRILRKYVETQLKGVAS